MRSFRSTGVALVTPFRGGQIDFDALHQLIEHCYQGGIDYVVALGTTGESPTLSKAEKHQLLDFVVEKVAGRMGVVAGFGGNNTKGICEDLENYHFHGIDAILSVSPYYNKPTQEGLYQHYMKLAEVAPRPIILYNVPGRTGSNLSAATTLRLAQHSDAFPAVKEASGNLAQCMQIIAHKPPGFTLLSGDDNLTLPLMALGAEGVISVVGQAYPKIFSGMVRSALAGEYEKAREAHYQLMELTDLLFVEGNPGGIKACLNALGLVREELRLPLYPVSAQTQAAIQHWVNRLG